MGLKQTCKFEWRRCVGLAVIVTAVLLGPSGVSAAKDASQESTSTVVSQDTPDTPKLSEIIPLAEELSARSAKLKNTNLGLPDLVAIEKAYSEIDARVTAASKKLHSLRTRAADQNVSEIGLKFAFPYEKSRLKKINQPLEMAIEQLDAWDGEWQDEKRRWKDWRSSLLKDRSYRQIRDAFDGADAIIHATLAFVSGRMEPLLAVQSTGARIKAKIDGLDAQMEAMQTEALRKSQHGKAPPMYSPDYYAQFNRALWAIAWEKLKFVPRPESEFFILYNLEFGILVFILITILAVIYRKRQAIAESENWSFVAHRPFATVLFITSLVATVQMQFWASPLDLVTTAIMVIGSMSCLRLMLIVLQSRRAKKASCVVMPLYAITVILIMTGLPSPIFNLFIVAISAATLVFFLKLAAECRLSKSGPYYLWGARVLYMGFAVILIAEILGRTGFAYSMFVNSVITMAAIAVIALFLYLLRGGIHWLFFLSPLWQVKLLRSDAKKNERKFQVIVETAVTLFLLFPFILSIWELFDSYPDALRGLFSPGFDISGQRITVGTIMAALASLYGSFYASQVVPKILLDEQILGRQMDRGVKGSMGHLIRYLIIFIGLLLTFSLLGFNLTNVTIILSALGVGIGFGLQGIVNNFVSGLILLFERPVREGDTIVLGENWALVKKIGMRATIVETFDLSEIVIPNADMLNNHVTNWTLSNRQVRLSLSVGVDYGSDVPLVVETVLACAKDNGSVVKSPAPEMLFLNLGDSSLDFTLRVWIQDVDNILIVQSELYHEIIRRFREKGIAIPFPQRDVHLYGEK